MFYKGCYQIITNNIFPKNTDVYIYNIKDTGCYVTS